MMENLALETELLIALGNNSKNFNKVSRPLVIAVCLPTIGN